MLITVVYYGKIGDEISYHLSQTIFHAPYLPTFLSLLPLALNNEEQSQNKAVGNRFVTRHTSIQHRSLNFIEMANPNLRFECKTEPRVCTCDGCKKSLVWTLLMARVVRVVQKLNEPEPRWLKLEKLRSEKENLAEQTMAQQAQIIQTLTQQMKEQQTQIQTLTQETKKKQKEINEVQSEKEKLKEMGKHLNTLAKHFNDKY
jgi:hypothetical protein